MQVKIKVFDSGVHCISNFYVFICKYGQFSSMVTPLGSEPFDYDDINDYLLNSSITVGLTDYDKVT